jgi:hypothetical protein
MKLRTIFFSAAVLGASVGLTVVFAFTPKETAKYFNGPTVTNITQTSAILSLSPQVLADITAEERSGVYFEYSETYKACVMIYPTPAECLPKKTEAGSTTVHITNLKPKTSYTIRYKRDNTIRCITTPCPGNEFESLMTTFVTDENGVVSKGPRITRGLTVGSRGSDVKALQEYLKDAGYLQAEATGYYGRLTVEAVRMYQKAKGIAQTGTVGPKTRAAITE